MTDNKELCNKLEAGVVDACFVSEPLKARNEVIAGKEYTMFIGNRPISIYAKREYNDDCVFRATKSLGINAKVLEEVDIIIIYLEHLKTVVMASKADIKNHKDIKTFGGEVRYYYPIEKWIVVAGNREWCARYKGGLVDYIDSGGKY